MPRLTAEQKTAIKEARGSLPVKDLCEKFKISKATYHRICSSDSDNEMKVSFQEDKQEIHIPSVDDDLFASILNGENPDKTINKDTLNIPELNESVKKDKPHKNIYREDAVDKLMENILHDTPLIAPKTKPMMTIEDRTEKNTLIQKIIMNVDNFLPLFKFIENKEAFVKSLPTKSIEDLKGLLEMMVLTRTTSNLATQLRSVFFVGSRLCEVSSAKIGLKLQGLTSALQQEREELNMVFKEIAIDYAPMFNVATRPEIRLGMLFCQTALAVDNTNRLKEIQQGQPSTEKYNDL